MFCPKCGTNVVAGGAFCPSCGTAIQTTPTSSAFRPAGDLDQNSAPTPQPQPRPVPQPNYVPRHAAQEPARVQAPMWDNVQHATPVAPAAPAAPAAPVRRAPAKKHSAPAKSPKLLIPIIAGVALIVVIALVIGILSITGGPLVKIATAAKKTVNTGNFTAEYTVEVDGEEVEGILYADIDVKNRAVTMHTVLEYEGMEMNYGIYDGNVFVYYDMSGYTYGTSMNIEDELDEIFDAYDDAETNDMGELLDQLDDLLYDYADVELSDYLDFEELEKCLTRYAKDANKEKWLEENAGFSKTKEDGETLYTFEPEAYELLVASLPYFETAFEDADLYDDAMDALEDMENDLSGDISMEYTLGVKSGYLSTIAAVIEVDGDEVAVELKLYDFNKTQLDEEALQDMLDEAESYD